MYEKLKRALESGLFNKSLVRVVEPPSQATIEERARSLLLPIHPEHRQLLAEWGGSALDEIRIDSLDQIRCDGQFVTFASDYNGSVFMYDLAGAVYVEDTDGGDVDWVASSVREFFDDVLLGPKCVSMYGEDWLEDLHEHGLV